MSGEPDNEEQMEAYSEAVKSGLYAKKSGLVGKYDNVRRYWEDETTRTFLRPHLLSLLRRRRSQMQRLRILDLGCGSADGYELLQGVRERNADLRADEAELLQPDVVGHYRGVDKNEDLLDQARDIYGDDPKMLFQQGDFSEGLPVAEDEEPYDLYFTSYGTCSHHNDDETMIRLLAQIAGATRDYSLIMCDWLGRYSYEWQTLWTDDLSENRNMDYVLSYIYEEEERERRRDELQHLWLRLVCREEVQNMIEEASGRAGVEIRPLAVFDRSIFTGRHMDTGDYNPHAQSIRKTVNSLHESNHRTDLDRLLVNYLPKPGFQFLNGHFEHLQMCWNTLVKYTDRMLETYEQENRSLPEDLPGPGASYPDALTEMMDRMRLVVEGIGWLGMGLPRENVIEPQLGYSLRYMMNNLQEGTGCAHGLVAILEVDRTGG
ncbi:MAG: class I SAM-dependent methyltransferase [Candidatus Brocadiaceae bacterium]|jgi:SAM-dependent methyltransferase